MTKLNNVRKGDRAEYITQGILSALGYSIQFLRQEDYGIDYLCTLTERSGNVSHPSKSYTIQLKTSYKNLIYRISDKRYKWLFENNLPYFVCYFDSKYNRVNFYSTSMLNHYLITKPKSCTKISLRMRTGRGNCVVNFKDHKKDKKNFIIDLGKPFVSISITELEKEVLLEERKAIIEKVLIKEYNNIGYRNLKLPFMTWLHKYKTNNKDLKFAWVDFSDEGIIKSSNLLKNIGHHIISLCNKYKAEKNLDSYNKLKSFVQELPFNDEYRNLLITFGYKDRNGNVL